MQAVILAAGKGSRLHPLTLERSKAMMPVAGKPMIARVMDLLKQAGLHEFIVVAHPQDHELHNYFAADKNVTLAWQAERKGAAHALSCAAPYIQADFVLSACDNLVSPDEASTFVRHFRSLLEQGQAGLLALIRVPKEKLTSMGMVDWDGEIIQRIVEKPALDSALSEVASIPLYGFSQRFLGFLSLVKPSRRGELELQEAMQMLITETQGLHGEMLSGRQTVTDASDLLALNLHFLAQEKADLRQWQQDGVLVIPPCLVEPGVEIAWGCTLGPNVMIETGAKIGKGAIINNALVLRGAVVSDGEIVENSVFD